MLDRPFGIGLAAIGSVVLLCASLFSATARGEDPDSGVSDRLKRLESRLDSQNEEIRRLRDDLKNARRAKPSVARDPSAKRATAESKRVAPASFLGPPPLGLLETLPPEVLNANQDADRPSPFFPEPSRSGRLSLGEDETRAEPLPESFSARSGAIGVGPGTSGSVDMLSDNVFERVLNARTPVAGYDKAFYVRNPNGPEILYVNFKFQNWFDAIAPNAGNPALGSTPGTPRQGTGNSTIRFRREELHFFGNITNKIGFKIMIDPSRAIGVDETGPQTLRILQDVFLTYTPKLWLGFRFGQYRVPQTMEGFWQDSGNLDFPEETLMTRSFGDTRDTGFMALGKPFDGIVEYYVGGFSGSRQNRLRDENGSVDLREWVGIHPLARYIDVQNRAVAQARKQSPSNNPEEPRWKEFMFGVSRRDGLEGTPLYGTYRGDATNVFADLEYARYILRAEWAQGRGINAPSVSFDPNGIARNNLLAKNAQGWYVTGGYNISKKWRPIIRHEEYRRDIDEPNNRVRITTIGLNFFPTSGDDYNRIGAHRMVIQAAYNFDHSDLNAHYFTGNEFTMNFQVSF